MTRKYRSGYPPASRPTSRLESAKELRILKDLADTAKVKVPCLDEAASKIAKASHIGDSVTVQSEPEGQLTRRLAEGLATGDLTIEKAITEINLAEASIPGGILDKAIKQVEEVTVRNAFREAGNNLDQDQVLKDLRASVAETVEQGNALRGPLEGIEDANQAVATKDRKVIDAWTEYEAEIMPRWTAAHDLTDRLRRLHWLPPLPKSMWEITTRPAWRSRFGRYDLYAEDWKRSTRLGGEPLPLLLIDPKADRWAPGGPYTEREIHGHLRAAGFQLTDRDGDPVEDAA